MWEAGGARERRRPRGSRWGETDVVDGDGVVVLFVEMLRRELAWLLGLDVGVCIVVVGMFLFNVWMALMIFLSPWQLMLSFVLWWPGQKRYL